MGSLYQNEFNFDSPNQDDMNAPANVHSELDLNRELEKYLGNNTDTVYESAPVAVPESPAPVYTPPVSNRGSRSPKLTDDQIKRYIEAKCWVNGIYLNSLDTEYLVNCKKFASQRLYDKWYWKYFLNLVNEEILNRDVAIGPKRYYPGTENIPRRGDYYNHRGRNYHRAQG